MNTKQRLIYERFDEKVVIDSLTGCWNWTASTTNGYGQFGTGPGKSQLAHRFSYERHKGPIPKGLVLDHLCRNPRCVNPAHLEAVTNRVNILRGEGPSAKQVHITHCPRGHDYSGIYGIVRRGKRECRECIRFLDRLRYQRIRTNKLARMHRRFQQRKEANPEWYESEIARFSALPKKQSD